MNYLENVYCDLIRLQLINRSFKTFITDFLYIGYVFKLSEDYLI